MTNTNSIKVWSRTMIDDAGNMSGWEYEGSFGVSPLLQQWIEANSATMLVWSRMMDCFYQVRFVNMETNEMRDFNEYD